MTDRVRIHVLPGGRLPKQQSRGAIGYDVSLRAIVSPHENDPEHKNLRKTLFDFERWPDTKEIQDCVVEKNGKLCYRLDPGATALGGIGFITEMQFPMFYWVAPRSGLSSKFGITVINAPGTVDPDYRGEAGVVIENRSNKPYLLEHQMRIAQIIFQYARIPALEEVGSSADLEETERGAGGFGSTGI